GLMVFSGILIGSAHFLLIECFRLAEAALVSPFKYSNLLWAILFGFMVWGDLPDEWTLAGAGIVVVSGLYILRREALRHETQA
ncbi:MAG: EamA/RhaT family transporter, partial [Rhodospirillales bacterium]|nr:EamA/RhaT family transporter [Rhodospirillales bacterium]